jgi:tetratricopeptide (TPR) repeat protein
VGSDFYRQIEKMMNFLNRLQFCALLLFPILTAAGPAMAADDVTARALKLYEKHHYAEAARLLRPELATMDSARQHAASLALGMIYLSSAKLYSELQQTALVIELDYLTQLSKQKTGTASRFVDFYLGEALLEAGKSAEAAICLRRFANTQGAQSPVKPFSDIELGIAYSRQKQVQKAARLWAGVDATKPEIKAALAGAYAVVGAQQHKPVLMADGAMNDAKTLSYIPTTRMIRNLLRAYSQGGMPDKALDLLNKNELKDASYVGDPISFYDLSLFKDIAKTHLSAAISYLEQASHDTKLSSTANYYLADAYLQHGNAELSLRASAFFLSQAQLTPQYRNIARILQASAEDMAGQRAEASEIWQSLSDKSADDPALLASVIQACAQAGADCSKLEKVALTAIERGDGKKFFSLNAALGKYYLLQKNYPKAMLYMEAGRDKAYKNKIEVNDPVMLVGLAEAYYRNKKFSENLEIYFEVGKQYPVVRQIQEAMQGIYSMEQQSAGEVKIF